jgi:hypothetical protein
VRPIDENSSPLEQRSRHVFDDQVAALDAHTLSRLNRARQSALDVARNNRLVATRWLIPAGSVAALAFAAVMMIRLGGIADPAKPSMDAHVEDLEIIASNEELDLLEDADFYESLDAMDAADSGVT